MNLPPLPDGHRARPPTFDDAPAVAAVIAACQMADVGHADMTVEELLDDWQALDLTEEAVVVTDADGRVVASADVLNRSFVSVSVYGYVDLDARGRGVGRWLVAWGERWAADRIDRAPPGTRVVVQHYLNARNEGARVLLESADYAPVRGVYVMERTLDGDVPEANWPDGIRVRTFVPGVDDRAAHDAHEEAFRDLWGRPRSTFERFQTTMSAEGFDPSLWFLAMGGEEIAGVLFAKVTGGKGWIDVVGVRRPWRRGGLGLALLHHAFAELARRGVRQVGLSVDAESITGAPRLYTRAGMHVDQQFIIVQKQLRPGVDLGDRSGEGEAETTAAQQE